MQAQNVQERKTALRHGSKDGYVTWLQKQGFKPEVSIALKSDLETLASGDRYYGTLVANSRILLVETIGLKVEKPGLKSSPPCVRYWQIMI